MRKITLVLISALILTGCKTQTAQAPQTQQQAMSEFAEISSAISAGRPIACTFTKTADNSVMNYVMQGKKVKVSGLQVAGQEYQGSMISDGEYMHTWDETKKEGVKMKLPAEQDLKEFAKEKGTNVPNLSDETERKNWEDQGYKIDCKETTLSPDTFVPPTDVKFTDMSAVMDSVKTIMKTDKPSEAPSEDQQKLMEEKVKEMMKQYQDQ